MRVDASSLGTLFASDPLGSSPADVGIYFSQFGEDLALWHFLSDRWNGFYVDIGAHHPYRFSNTALLYRFRHWRGINVDLDDRAISAFDQHRPGDTNVQAALSDTGGKRLQVTRYVEGAINTADPKMAALFSELYPVHDTLSIRSRTLADILGEHTPNQGIDLLSIDVEGLELEVMLGNDWSTYRPEYVLVERHDFDLSQLLDDDVFRLLSSHGYKLLSHMVITSLYVRHATA